MIDERAERAIGDLNRVRTATPEDAAILKRAKREVEGIREIARRFTEPERARIAAANDEIAQERQSKKTKP